VIGGVSLNFVFDVGNVLVEYEPAAFLGSLFSDDMVAEKMYDTIFKSREWLLMDQGRLSHEEAVDIFNAREPDFQSEIRLTMQNVNSMFNPISDTVRLLPIIKNSGHGLYYLSNIHKEIRDFLIRELEYFSLFDGGVFSCDIGATKPSPEIYRHFIEKYRLTPDDCLFFDDMEENVSAAEKEGIKSVLFTTADCVAGYL